jgi:hypothetical protein
VVDSRVGDVIDIVLRSEPLKLNPDLAWIGGSDSAVVNLGARLLQELEKTDRLEISCNADILGN